jgi:hypothetical protein
MKEKCPSCNQKTIRFFQKTLMHGTFKTRCNNCGSILITTPKWNLTLFIPTTILFMLMLLFFIFDNTLLLLSTLGVNLVYVLVIYKLIPLAVPVYNVPIPDIAELGFLRNNMLLFKKDNALEAIGILENKNIKILGIDSFIIKGKTIQPYMDYSSDYSRVYKEIDSFNQARNDILAFSDHNEDFVFEIGHEYFLDTTT